MHVEKHKIGNELFDCGDGRVAAVRFSDYLDARFGAEKAQDFPARGSFVVNNEDVSTIGF